MADYKVGGFHITNDPPYYDVKKDRSDTYQLSTSEVQIVPLQTLNLTSDNSTSSGNFQFQNDPNNKWDTDPGMNCFIVQPGDTLSSFILTLDEACPLIPLIFGMELLVGELNREQHARFKIIVNGHEEPHIIEKEDPKWAEFHTVTWQVPAEHLQVGQNNIIFTSSSHHSRTSIDIRSASIYSSSEQNKLNIQASYYWNCVFSVLAVSPITVDDTETITKNLVTKDTEVYSFAETMGISLNEGASDPLLGELSYSINTSFTATQSDEYSVEITNLQTEEKKVSISPKAKMRVQGWQCCLQFTINDKSIVQELPIGSGTGLVFTQYPSDSEATTNIVVK